MIERVNPIFNYDIGYNIISGTSMVNCLYYHHEEDVGGEHSLIRIASDHRTKELFRDTLALRTKIYSLTNYEL